MSTLTDKWGALLKQGVSWMTPGKFYHTDRTASDVLGYWFYALDGQKNGKMKGVFVTWWVDSRMPDKGKLQSVDPQWARDWKEVEERDLPPQVLAKMKRSNHFTG